MVLLLLFFNLSAEPKIVYQPIYIFNPIIIVVKEGYGEFCGCDEFILEDEKDITWGEIEE